MGFRNPLTSLAATQITPGALPAGVSLTPEQITAGTLPPDVQVAASQIAAGLLSTGVQLAADQVTPGQLGAGVQLAATQITAGTLPASVIAAALKTGTVTAAAIAPGAVTSGALGTAAVTAPAIAAGAIVAGAIATNAVTAAKIAAGAIGAGAIAAGAITAGAIAAGAITAVKLDVNALNGKTIVGTTLATAASGKRVLIATPGGDAGRIDFYSDPNSAGHSMHAQIEAYAFGGVSDRGYLDLTPDSAGVVRLGSHDLPSGGYATAVDLIAQQVLVGTGASVFNVARTSRSITGASLGGIGTADSTPAGCSFALSGDLDAGKWLLLASGQCDWATGTLAPRYRLRLKSGATVLDEVGMYIGILSGTAPFLIAAPVTITASATVAFTVAQTNTGIGGSWNVSGVTFAALPIG